GLCMTGNETGALVNQTSCASTSIWNFWGYVEYILCLFAKVQSFENVTESFTFYKFSMPYPFPLLSNDTIATHNATVSQNTTTTGNSDINLPVGALVGIIIGSFVTSTLISLLVWYFFIERKRTEKFEFD